MNKDLKNGKYKDLHVEFINDEIRISIGVEVLAFAVETGPNWPEEYLVDDTEKFAKSMLLALGHEDEEGTNAIHRMFDDAAEYALDQGFEGFAELVGEEELND